MTQEFRGDGHTAADDTAGDFRVSAGGGFVSQGEFPSGDGNGNLKGGADEGHERPQCQRNDVVGQVSGVDKFDAVDEPHDACHAGAGETNLLATVTPKNDVVCLFHSWSRNKLTKAP